MYRMMYRMIHQPHLRCVYRELQLSFISLLSLSLAYVGNILVRRYRPLTTLPCPHFIFAYPVAVGKGTAAFDALSRIAASTWGPCLIRTRLLYTAIVRPAIVYGAHAWHTGKNGKQIKANLQQLEKIQNKCLRRITGGYKRTPRAALEREAKILPLDLYCDGLIMNKALDEKDKKVKEEIKQTVDAIWEAEHQHQTQRNQRRR